MQISGLGYNTLQSYQSIKSAQQSQPQVKQESTVNPATQMNASLDPDHDGDIDGKGKDIDVRV